MTERPILFSAPMVRALLAGTKTQTRRIVKPQPDVTEGWGGCTRLMFKKRNGEPILNEALTAPEPRLYPNLCPYGVPGDALWVRENFRLPLTREGQKPKDCAGAVVCYEADRDNYSRLGWGKLHPAIHLPRWASRITLRVTDVRVERLNEIDDADSMAEGVGLAPRVGWMIDSDEDSFTTPRLAYRTLWERINGAGSWDANPWVWAVSFEMLR